ncbi:MULTISPECIES: recombinase family protein [Providencia]|uniref:recombinase family protein n=1 Tax=Providencia TaxID=586 RepID=UPI00155E9EB4|nr:MULTISPECIES: recombinase family protein [Providencia]QKG45329.1 recombinase family protein [Providencia rettgeri]QNN31565.1 recombinase family protein [Providencia rettgeri]
MKHFYTELIGNLINVTTLNGQGNYEHVCFVPLSDIPQMAESGHWDEDGIAVGIVTLETYLTHVQTNDTDVLIALRNLIALLFLVEVVRETGMTFISINGEQHPVTAPITRLFLALSAEENFFSKYGANGLKEVILAYRSMLTDDHPPKLTVEGIACVKGVYQNCIDAIKEAKGTNAITTKH